MASRIDKEEVYVHVKCASHCDELMRVNMDLLQKNMSLLGSTMLQNTLDNPAAIGMRGHRIYL